jgi:type II secretory ATPase GspE/PulE/Tfp pilus assembly ATPase PilB-like protein
VNTTDIERAVAALSRHHQVLDAEVAARLIRDARVSSRPLSEMLRENVAEADLLAAVAKELGVRFADLNKRDFELVNDRRILGRCDTKFLSDKAALPLVSRDGRVVVVMANPLDADAVAYMRTKFPEGFTAVLAPRAQVLARLLQLTSGLATTVSNGPNAVPEWVDSMLARSVAERASDVHFRFLNDGNMMVRVRVDGVLRQVQFPDALKGRETEVIGTILARCQTIDPSNTREPQDGTFSFAAGGRPIDVRVGMLPQVTGTNITLRLLDSLTLRRRPEEMGFRDEHLTAMRAAIASAQGCVVVVGPTGSGKTTTLYALLREVDAISRNVLTVEDPVEYRLPYVGQTQIRSDLGERSLTWARALRSIVRNDPDVILVGEARDSDVAKVAMEASITGHMVLTTLHAHSAPGAYSRLVQMGVPGYLVADAVSLIISQRLLRQVHDCATMSPPTREERATLEHWGLEVPDLVAHVAGCPGCSGSGYSGRLAAAELLAPDATLRNLVSAGSSSDTLREAAMRTGWMPIRHDGLRLIKAGLTTVSELTRTLSDAEADEAHNETREAP